MECPRLTDEIKRRTDVTPPPPRIGAGGVP